MVGMVAVVSHNRTHATAFTCNRIPAALCGVNLALVTLYWWFERSVPARYQPPLGRNAYAVEKWSKRKFGLKTLYQL